MTGRFGAAPFLEFRPESADTFGAGAWIPAKTGAEEFVPLFAFEAAAASFLVKVTEFGGVLHPLGKARSQGRTLAPWNSGAVEFRDGIPTDVPLGVQ